MTTFESIQANADYLTTHQVARMLGVTVRSVQLMVNRGELNGWRTQGGHRRILKESFDRWVAARKGGAATKSPERAAAVGATRGAGKSVLLIEDSVYFQNLVGALFAEHFDKFQLHLASDGVIGLAMAGQLQPDVLIVDILLPGMDGASLIMSLRSHAFFARTQLIVLTSLTEAELEKYRFALKGVAVVHKPQMVGALPPLLERMLGASKLVGLAPTT